MQDGGGEDATRIGFHRGAMEGLMARRGRFSEIEGASVRRLGEQIGGTGAHLGDPSEGGVPGGDRSGAALRHHRVDDDDGGERHQGVQDDAGGAEMDARHQGRTRDARIVGTKRRIGGSSWAQGIRRERASGKEGAPDAQMEVPSPLREGRRSRGIRAASSRAAAAAQSAKSSWADRSFL